VFSVIAFFHCLIYDSIKAVQTDEKEPRG